MLTSESTSPIEAVPDGARLPVRREIPPRAPRAASGLAGDIAPEAADAGRENWPAVATLAALLVEALDAAAAAPAGERVRNLADELQVEVDRLIGGQLALVMTHPRFRRLEGSWRGLAHVVATQARYHGAQTEVRVVDYGAGDLRNDLGQRDAAGDETRALTRSWLFRTLHESAWDQRGARLFGMLVSGIEFGGDAACSDPADAAVWPDLSAAHQWSAPETRDSGPPDGLGGLGLLRKVALIAEMAFCPFIASASPLLLGRRDFGYLADDPAVTTVPALRSAWAALRQAQESRFVGLVAPRVVLRKPLAELRGCAAWFGRPAAPRPPRADLAHRPLLGSGAYALGAVVIRSVAETNWPADIQGAEDPAVVGPVSDTGGVVLLKGDHLPSDPPGVCSRPPVELTLTGQQERRLGQIGLLTLARIAHTPKAAFYALRMAREPVYGEGAGVNATQEMHSLLPYILTASQFAQMVRLFAQKNHGRFQAPEDLEAEMRNLLSEYKGESRVLRHFDVKVTRQDAGRLRIHLEISPRLSADDVEVTGVIPLTTTVIDQRSVGMAGADATPELPGGPAAAGETPQAPGDGGGGGGGGDGGEGSVG